MKVIVRIKGGLGNQLFCYAAARRLSFVNNAELIIDSVSGFTRDRQYKRQYGLPHFKISSREATPWERFVPFERIRRGVLKVINRHRKYNKRFYIEQLGIDNDLRLLELKLGHDVYLDGYWQSEDYFKDIENIIREDFKIIQPTDELNLKMAEKIKGCPSIGVHVRWYENPSAKSIYNVSADYYMRAINEIEKRIPKAHYFVFSEDSLLARSLINVPDDRITSVSHNVGSENAYSDLWLMTLCKSFIVANSTFSWWGAWLGGEKEKVIIAPAIRISGEITNWGFDGLIPDEWIKV